MLAQGAGSTGSIPVRKVLPIPVLLAAAMAVCGALMSVKLIVVGELFVGEILLIVTAAIAFLLRGVGRQLAPWFFWTFAAAGMLMLVGYVLADLVAETAPSQYLRGWARTSLFGLDFLALLVLVSYGERVLWWFALGLAVGLMGDALATEEVLSVVSWKRGYGFPIGLLLALLVGVLPPLLSGTALGAFGVVTLMLDFRSLGGVFLLAAGMMTTRVKAASFKLSPLMRWLLALVGALMALGLIMAIVTGSDDEYHRRRLESNIGRYVGVVVAAQAIVDSPIIGYGSWAGDKHYLDMLRREVAKASAGKDVTSKVGQSILPHSQLLQVWVEGGILAAIFFLLLGFNLLRALRWLILNHASGPMTPLYAVVVLNALWNLLFTPFLGLHRIYVAFALAALSLLAWERSEVGGRRRPYGSPLPYGAEQQKSTKA